MTEILLVDDDPLQLKLLARTLNGLGYTQLVGCSSAVAALHALHAPERRIGLILLDLNMPGVDGVAFLKLLSERRAEIPVVLVSGEDERLIETAARFGASQNLTILGSVPKPVWPAELRVVLDRWQRPATPFSTPRQYSADEVANAIRRGELIPHYQPKVDLVAGAVVGVEALVRWRHPKDGMVMPGQFLAMAEACGFICDVTSLMLHAALAQCAQWRESGQTLSVAVNVSMADLARADFADTVLAAVERSGLPPRDLVLEVGEQGFAQNPDAALATVSRLRLRRITMAIDDFGTGIASLAQLRDLPFNEMKVDGSFLHGAGSSAILAAIVESSLDLAQRLGLRTIAAGVEDSADWAWLRTKKCDHAQGYFIGPPMPAADLPAWLAAWEKRRTQLYDA